MHMRTHTHAHACTQARMHTHTHKVPCADTGVGLSSCSTHVLTKVLKHTAKKETHCISKPSYHKTVLSTPFQAYASPAARNSARLFLPFHFIHSSQNSLLLTKWREARWGKIWSVLGTLRASQAVSFWIFCGLFERMRHEEHYIMQISLCTAV